MIDTHTHLYFPEYGEEIKEVILRCQAAGVTHCILPNVDVDSIKQVKEIHTQYPEFTSMAIGLHPTEVKEDWEEAVSQMENEAQTGEYIAIGEIGMDLYWDKSTKELQKQAFEQQLRIAENLKLPVIIHCREAFPETLEVIKRVSPTVPLVFHSFTSDRETVKKIREVCDPYFGINGVVTYKNAPDLRDALGEIGIDRIVLETDAPYLSPVPHRGKRNESSFISHVRDQVAASLGISVEEVERATDANAKKIFGI